MTTHEPPPSEDPQSTSGGLPSYGSTPPPSGGYPPPPQGGYGAPGGYAAPEGNKKALWSMILGIIGLLCCGFLAGIPAIILASIAKKEIAASGGRQTGSGQATAGLVLGIIAVVWGIIYIILVATGAITFDFSASST